MTLWEMGSAGYTCPVYATYEWTPLRRGIWTNAQRLYEHKANDDREKNDG